MKAVRFALFTIALLLMNSTLAAQGPIAQSAGQHSYPADRPEIGPNGETIHVATVPGVLEARFTVDDDGRVVQSVIIESKSGRIAGVGSGAVDADDEREMAQPMNMGPPANYTGIWLLAEFEGGGRLYGEYVSGTRTGTIIEQPDGTIVYLPR